MTAPTPPLDGARSENGGPSGPYEVAIIGAGLGGLAVAHRLGEIGVENVAIFERDDGVGGTWRANCYPGAACDVPSHLYSLSFAPNPHWSSTYAGQPEILSYIEGCFDRFAISEKVRFSTPIVSALWHEDRQAWTLTDDYGKEHEAAVVVSAVGLFNTLAEPAIDGIKDFRGTMFHSSRWNRDHDLTGRRVAVIGTGATAIQVVPAIARRTGHLMVYQRTSAWILPRKNEMFTDEQKQVFASDPDALTRHRDELYELFEQNNAFVSGSPFASLLAEVAARLPRAQGSRSRAEGQAHPGLPPRLQTRPGVERLLSGYPAPRCRARHGPHRAHYPHGDTHRGRDRARMRHHRGVHGVPCF